VRRVTCLRLVSRKENDHCGQHDVWSANAYYCTASSYETSNVSFFFFVLIMFEHLRILVSSFSCLRISKGHIANSSCTIFQRSTTSLSGHILSIVDIIVSTCIVRMIKSLVSKFSEHLTTWSALQSSHLFLIKLATPLVVPMTLWPHC